MIPCKTLLIRFTNYDMMGLFIKKSCNYQHNCVYALFTQKLGIDGMSSLSVHFHFS